MGDRFRTLFGQRTALNLIGFLLFAIGILVGVVLRSVLSAFISLAFFVAALVLFWVDMQRGGRRRGR
jgi:hypothetical protein